MSTTFAPLPERLSTAEHGTLSNALTTCAALGGVASLIAAFTDPHQFAYSWIWAFFCYYPLVIGALFWILLHYICDSNWSVVPRRIWENLAGTTWVLIPVFLVAALVPQLREIVWSWTNPIHANDPDLITKAAWLNFPFFLIRALVFFGFYCGLATYYRRNSIAQDATGNPAHWARLRDWSYVAMTVWALVQTFAGIDWLMGLDFKWYSSLFGVYTFAFSVQGSLSAGIVLLAVLRSQGHLLFLNAEHFQLMGKLLFGFTIFWGYITFGQYLLTWYANIPAETIFYNDHNRGNWQAMTWMLIVGKFIFPVIFLLPQETKRNFNALTGIALWLVFMHFLEMYWLVLPYCHLRQIVLSWPDLAAFVTVTSLVGLVYIRNVYQAALFPLRDPRLKECLTTIN